MPVNIRKLEVGNGTKREETDLTFSFLISSLLPIEFPMHMREVRHKACYRK